MTNEAIALSECVREAPTTPAEIEGALLDETSEARAQQFMVLISNTNGHKTFTR